MSYKFMIDSSAWIEYFGGTEKGEKARRIIEAVGIATSIIAIAELADKFEREGRDFHPSLQFIKSKAAIIELTAELALLAAKLKKTARKKSPKFGIADALHLATAIQEKAVLVTADKDFLGLGNTLLI